MTKHAFIFLGTFILGAVIALTVRAARNDTPATPAPHAAAHAHDHASPSLETQNSKPETARASAPAPVNTVCSICGMEVDPSLGTAEYQGKTIGFGCRACPPKFKANPGKYGPAALRNEVVQ